MPAAFCRSISTGIFFSSLERYEIKYMGQSLHNRQTEHADKGVSQQYVTTVYHPSYLKKSRGGT